MSEVADKLCAAIQKEAEKQRQQILASVKIELPLREVMWLKDKELFQNKAYQAGLIDKVTDLLRYISPECQVIIPALQAGHSTCFQIDRTENGATKTNLIGEAFAFPKDYGKEPKK